MGVINRKERFATEGVRFQRHNPDGTIPSPQRFLGFANTVDLSAVLTAGKADLNIKLDSDPVQTKQVDFTSVADLTKVTVDEAVSAINAAAFTDITFTADGATTRLKGSYTGGGGTAATITVECENQSGSSLTIPADTYVLSYMGNSYMCVLATGLVVTDGTSEDMVFVADAMKPVTLPTTGNAVLFSAITPALPSGASDWVLTYKASTQGVAPVNAPKVVQVTGPLAAALDFGNCLKHGGNGLVMISFFDDETISIGLPKDIKDKEEIDIEGAKGTITRMVIGAMLQGISPVVTLKQKDYNLLELIQGGKLDRENGTYNPPLSKESDHPSFYAEIFSALYSDGSNKISDVAGYEQLLLRSMIGMEGDVPIEAKAWAQYAFNLTATEYTDMDDKAWPAYQEKTLTLEEFDALKVKQI